MKGLCEVRDVFGWRGNAECCKTHITIRHQGESPCACAREGEVFYSINLLSAYFRSYRVAEEETHKFKQPPRSNNGVDEKE